MCGRYGASWGVDDMVAEYEVVAVESGERLVSDWNVAPTKPVYAVLDRPPRGEGPDAAPQRRLMTLRWGLVPSWSRAPSIASRLINARLETAHEKPSFREAFAKRRCILPADGYYEWMPVPSAVGVKKGSKQPYFIRNASGGGLSMAGLYEFWRDPTRDRDDPGAWLGTCTILTTSASDRIGHIHDRQPLFVAPDAYTAWLDPMSSDPAWLRTLLDTAPGFGLEAYPVSTAVNDHRNNGEDLVEPLADATPQMLF